MVSLVTLNENLIFRFQSIESLDFFSRRYISSKNQPSIVKITV